MARPQHGPSIGMNKCIISLYFPCLMTDRLARSQPLSWQDKPLVIMKEVGNRQLVIGANKSAVMSGLTKGMTIADARIYCSSLRTIIEVPEKDARFLNSLARLCRRIAPEIALDGNDGLIINAAGLIRLYGRRENIIAALLAKFEALDVNVQLAMASTKGAAYALARYHPHAVKKPLICLGKQQVKTALGSLPVRALRLEVEAVKSLNQLGLRHIKKLYDIAPHTLNRRFSEHVIERLHQALGTVPEPITYLRYRTPYIATQSFPEPLIHQAAIEIALDGLFDELTTALKDSQKGARHIRLLFERTDNQVIEYEIGTSEPTADHKSLTRLAKMKLDGLDVGFGIDRIVIKASSIAPLKKHQTEITLDEHSTCKPTTNHNEARSIIRDESPDAAAYSQLIDRLSNRIGFGHIHRFAPAESHIPERAIIVFSGAALSSRSQRTVPPWTKNLPRPLELISPPSPIILTISDNESAQSFTWQGKAHQIAKAIGPERIEPEWWWDDPLWRSGPRDYWRIETANGAGFWIYRTPSQHRSNKLCWFLHGLFG